MQRIHRLTLVYAAILAIAEYSFDVEAATIGYEPQRTKLYKADRNSEYSQIAGNIPAKQIAGYTWNWPPTPESYQSVTNRDDEEEEADDYVDDNEYVEAFHRDLYEPDKSRSRVRQRNSDAISPLALPEPLIHHDENGWHWGKDVCIVENKRDTKGRGHSRCSSGISISSMGGRSMISGAEMTESVPDLTYSVSSNGASFCGMPVSPLMTQFEQNNQQYQQSAACESSRHAAALLDNLFAGYALPESPELHELAAKYAEEVVSASEAHDRGVEETFRSLEPRFSNELNKLEFDARVKDLRGQVKLAYSTGRSKDAGRLIRELTMMMKNA